MGVYLQETCPRVREPLVLFTVDHRRSPSLVTRRLKAKMLQCGKAAPVIIVKSISRRQEGWPGLLPSEGPPVRLLGPLSFFDLLLRCCRRQRERHVVHHIVRHLGPRRGGAESLMGGHSKRDEML